MANTLYIFDVDATLFDREAFVRYLPTGAGQAFGLNANTFKSEITSFYQSDGTGALIGYDLYAHFASHAVDLTTPALRERLQQTLLQLRQSSDSQPDYLFPDARNCLSKLKHRAGTVVSALSVNIDSCLQFKANLCGPSIQDMSFASVQVNKGTYLHSLWGTSGPLIYHGQTYDTVVVTDDTADQLATLPLRADITQMQIVRSGQAAAANTAGIRIIASLGELQA